MPRLFLASSWLVLCCLAMLSPGKAFPEVAIFSFQDKIIHFSCFFILAYLWVGWGIQNKTELIRNRRLWINFLLFGLLPALVLETAQQQIPFRTFDWFDLVTNILGVIIGLIVFLFKPFCKIILD